MQPGNDDVSKNEGKCFIANSKTENVAYGTIVFFRVWDNGYCDSFFSENSRVFILFGRSLSITFYLLG